MTTVVLSIALAVAIVLGMFLFHRTLQMQREASENHIKALRDEFAMLASNVLQDRIGDLTRQNAETVRPLFEQLKEKFNELKFASEEATRRNVEMRAGLFAKMDEVGAKAQNLGRQADEFVTALRGGNKIQGNWGEGILTKVLEDAGLVRDLNFTEQKGSRDAGLPDVTVFDGNHRKILIDAKVNITHFIAASNADRDGNHELARREQIEHAKSVRSQIKGLAERRYPECMKMSDPDSAADYSEVVVMMMPSEATYAAAVMADPSIVSYATSLRIVIASPQMLFGYLVLFKTGLDRLQMDKHHQEIANAAKNLVERMDAAFDSLEEVEVCLKKANEAYHNALGKLGGESNPKNVLVPAREIIRLAKPSTRFKSNALMN